MLRRPPQQTFQTFYPPTRKGQKKGMRKKRKTKTKRRKKTNLRREIKREQTASMPFRTFQQVQKTAPNYQQSLDFLTLLNLLCSNCISCNLISLSLSLSTSSFANFSFVNTLCCSAKSLC